MTTTLFSRKALIAALFLIITVCSRAYGFPFSAADDRHKEITIAARPARIISLAPTNTELLFALGLDKEIVGVTRYCDYPEAARAKEKVGGFTSFDLDRIAALHPDLILAFGTLQLPVVEELEKRGQTVFWLYPRTIDEILMSFDRVGRITGRADEARRLRDDVEKDVKALRKAFDALPDEKRPSIFRLMSFIEPGTIGADSFQTDLFRLAGGRNAFPAPGKDYFELDPRDLAAVDPSIILVCGSDEGGLKQKTGKSPLYRNLNAVKTNSILVIPCDLTCRPGPRIGVMARRLADSLHPGWEQSGPGADRLVRTK